MKTALEIISDSPVLCIDADDTTNNYFLVFIEWHNAVYRTSFIVDDFWTRKFHLVLGCNGEEAKRRVDEFQHSNYFKKIMPLEGAVDAVNLLHDLGKKLYIVTARDNKLMQETATFYDKYFPGKLQEIIHSSNSHTGKANSGKTKSEICDFLGGATLIDDDLDYLFPGAILFGNYKWQKDADALSIPRLKDWSEL